VFGGIIIANSNTRPGCNELEISNTPCLRCGTCCCKFQPRIDLSEAHIICDKLGLTWERFLTEFTDPRWPGTLSLLIRHINGGCIFLTTSGDGKQSLCSIHDYKPSCCRDWKSGLDRIECQEGLFSKWGLVADSNGRITGTKQNLELFKDYSRILK
jgi:Fe-S-cluster containining protein